jgi:type I restriction enzyme R subunit
MHEDMRRVFPRACYIGFTGTPLFKDRARNTFLKFGPLIDRYAIEDAVKDGAVLPLVYEGRAVEQDVSDAALDAWFERTSEGLTPQQKGELKTRMSSAKTLATVPARLKMIAWDIREHFLENFAGTGLKGQVVAMNKAAAVRLLAIFDELNEVEGPKVKARVVISGPDAREGHEDVDSEGARGEVQAFWARMMKEFGDEDRYNAAIVEAFDSPDPPDLLIVVSKLLTGFDVQRNSVLYLAQPLKEHNLLQAIARVNRVFEDDDAPPKRFGMIVDYCGVLEDLSGALTSYAALGGYDEADIRGAISSIRDEAAQLPDLHRELLAMFDGISNRFDFEAYAIALADEDLRDRFHRALSAYASALNLALASREFLESEKPERVRRWKADLARFEALRQEARRRYGEAFDWSRYEARVQKLLDEHVTAGDVSVVVEPLDILDETALADALAGQGKRSDASMADEIASKMSRTITERMDQDPAFFGPFSEMVRKTIEAFRQRRIDERAYLERIRELHETAAAHLKGESDDVPAGLLGDGDAIAFWGVVRQELVQAGIAGQAAAERIATVMLGIVKANLRVGWQDDAGAEHGILTAFEDWALDKAPAELGFPLSLEFVDLLAPRLIAVARERLRR